MRQNTLAKNFGLVALWLCVVIIISTVIFTYFGYLLPSHVHTDTAVPIMLLLWSCGLPISFSFGIVSYLDIESRSLGVATFFGHAIFWIVIIAQLFW